MGDEKDQPEMENAIPTLPADDKAERLKRILAFGREIAERDGDALRMLAE